MKKILLFALMLIGLNINAQDSQEQKKPVKWISYLKANAEGGTDLIIKAKMDEGWHIFTANPGGDGLAIPTTIVVSMMQGDNSMELPVGDEVASQAPKKMKIEGMGEVNYYEKEVSYAFPIDALQTRKFDVTIEYQTCNDKMCLPPVKELIEVSDSTPKE